MDKAKRILSLSRSLSSELGRVSWKFDGFVCNPLEYARDNYEAFVNMSVMDGQKVLFLGMNPGPYGMMQTGVPFGEIDAVRNYLGLHCDIIPPKVNPPGKRIEGMNVKRHEVSGRKFWKMAADYGTPEDFFSKASVFSFCPLAFISGSRNVTPDELPAEDREAIDVICSSALSELLSILSVPRTIALGRYAEKKLKAAGVESVAYFPHPSPRSRSSMAFWDSGEALACFRRVADET